MTTKESTFEERLEAVKHIKTTPVPVTRAFNTAAFVVLIWMILNMALPLFLNGNIYHIESPVPIQEIHQDRVDMLVTRNSRFTMSATCSTELTCDHIYNFPDVSCPIEKGQQTFVIERELPPAATGICYYVGIVTYKPFGPLGPELTHEWSSEEFVIE